MVGGKNSSLSDLYEVSPPKLPIELPSMVTIMIVIIFIMMTMKMMTIIAMTTMVMTMTMAMINSISSGTLGVWWNPCKHFRVPWVFPMLQGKLINFHTLQSFHMLQGKFELLIHLGCKVSSPGNLINWHLVSSLCQYLIFSFSDLVIWQFHYLTPVTCAMILYSCNQSPISCYQNINPPKTACVTFTATYYRPLWNSRFHLFWISQFSALIIRPDTVEWNGLHNFNPQICRPKSDLISLHRPRN